MSGPIAGNLNRVVDNSDGMVAGGHSPALCAGRRGLVVLAGLPGAGKSTLLRRSRLPAGARVLDSDQVRARLPGALPRGLDYRWYRPLVHLVHRLRIAWSCVSARGPVVAHEPSTRATTRTMLVLFGRLTGRPRILVWLHVDPDQALAGQRARGRLVRVRSFRRHVQRATRISHLLRLGRAPRGWTAVHTFVRADVRNGLHVRAE